LNGSAAHRLRKLEKWATGSRLIVIEGRSDAEHSAAIETMKARGDATEHDLFVCLVRFGELR